jgi:HemY protein
MRNWFWTTLLFTLAVVVALVIDRHPGNVMIVVDNLSVQVSLAFAVFISIVGFLTLYFLLRLLAWLTNLPMRVRNWQGERKAQRDQDLLEDGWAALIEGRYTLAEQALTKLSLQTKNHRRQVLAGLSAARAAHALGEYTRRDQLISQAQATVNSQTINHKVDQKVEQNLNVAIAAAAADLWLDQGLAQQALDTMLASGADSSKHVHTMRILLRAYQQLNDHSQVLAMAHQLKRMKAIQAQEADRLVDVAGAAQIRDAQRRGDWQPIWKSLRSDEKLLPDVALAGAQAFESSDQIKEASRVLENAIEHSFDARVLEAYASVEGQEVNRRLQKAEAWLVKRPNDAKLLVSLGSLCLASQMWGQAQRYFERSLAVHPDPHVHALLGSMFDRIGKPDLAAKQWRLATTVGASLPVLSKKSLLPAADLAADPDFNNVGGWVELGDEAADQKKYVAEQVAAPVPSDAPYEEYFDSAPPTVPNDIEIGHDVSSGKIKP